MRTGAELAGLRALCERYAQGQDIRATMAFGPGLFGYGEPGEVVLLALLDRLKPGVRGLRAGKAYILLADERLFRLDVRTGAFGDLLADKLLLPYVALEGARQLHELELKFKERLIRGILADLASDLPEFAGELYVDPRYFLYEAILRIGRMMPLSAYMFANLLASRADRRANEPRMMKGFAEVLRSLEARGYLSSQDGYLRLADKALRKGFRAFLIADLVYGLTGALRSLRKHIIRLHPGLARPYQMEKEAFIRRFGAKTSPFSELPRPTDFLFLRTHLGLRPAFARVVLEEIAKLLGPIGPRDDITISEIGGSLNVVYLVSVRSDSGSVRFIVKKFKNWNDLKWLSLRLWSFGAKKFVISGRKRLKREYCMCRLLGELGFPVPKVFHVDLATNTLVEEFIEGPTLAKPMREFFFGGEDGGFLELVERAGELVAGVHAHDIALGDCKPENFIIRNDGLYIVDLEQASRGGEKAWDVAEFLYYSGHFVPSLMAEEVFEPIARAFLRGYLTAGGSRKVVREASSVKFARVFSVFTPSQVIRAINRACREEAA